MKKTLSTLLVVSFLAAGPAQAEPSVTAAQPRGFLTVLGLSLLAGSLAGVGVGVAGVGTSNDAAAILSHYDANSLSAADAPQYKVLSDRASLGQGLTVGGFTAAGLLLAGAITCLVLDGRRAPVVSFVPTPGGGAFAMSLRF